MKTYFEIGRLVATAGVAATMKENKGFAEFVNRSLARFLGCDWGEMDDSDKDQNESALKNNNDRLFASYENKEHPDWKLWIITEWDHSATTLLFPDEY